MVVQICLAKGKGNKMGSVPKPTSYIGPQFISGPVHCEIWEVDGNGAVPMVVRLVHEAVPGRRGCLQLKFDRRRPVREEKQCVGS